MICAFVQFKITSMPIFFIFINILENKFKINFTIVECIKQLNIKVEIKSIKFVHYDFIAIWYFGNLSN